VPNDLAFMTHQRQRVSENVRECLREGVNQDVEMVGNAGRVPTFLAVRLRAAHAASTVASIFPLFTHWPFSTANISMSGDLASPLASNS
jgi:hypothetical protein